MSFTTWDVPSKIDHPRDNSIGLVEGNSIAVVVTGISFEDMPDGVNANAFIDGLDNADDDHADDEDVDFNDEFNDDADSLEPLSLLAIPRSTHPHHRKVVVLPLEYLGHQLFPQPFCTHSSIS